MKLLLTKIKDKLYNKLVRKVPIICQQYEGYVNANKQEHQKHRLKSWKLLLKLNIAYHILKIDLKNGVSYTDKYPYCQDSESSLSYLGSPDEFAKKLLDYDIISFDIFDTLIFRPFKSPVDLFYIVAEKLNYLDFANLRVFAEYQARLEKKEKSNTEEITILDIYQYVEEHIGIKSLVGLEKELETEKDLCFANPFMKEVFEILKKHNKKIILISDMYLTKDMIIELINSCGYNGFSDVFVSCEYEKSKHQGDLYTIVKNIYGNNKSYIHIGDNPYSDFKKAKENGFDTLLYKNVNEIGNMYRCDDMSQIIGSAYSGIINTYLHNGLNKFSLQYEFGFIYGGLFVLGYCNFINEYVKKHNIDKVLFLARDGDILKQVYDKLYPNSKTEYVYWSRLAAAKLSANHYKYDYIRRFIHHKINSNITIKQTLHSMELDSLLSCYQDNSNEILNSKNAKTLEKFILDNWDSIIDIYTPQIKAGKLYYKEILYNCKNVCAVDIGWAGSGANNLSYMINDVWDLNCNVIGIIAGTNSKNNAEPNTSEAMLQSNKLISYMYSQSNNRNYWNSHNPSLGHNIIMEMLLSSLKPSFKGFDLDEFGKYQLQFLKEETENHFLIKEIQNGIMDFINYYTLHFSKYPYMLNISGSDAYSPINFAFQNENKYFKYVLKDCFFQAGIGDDKNKTSIETML